MISLYICIFTPKPADYQGNNQIFIAYFHTNEVLLYRIVRAHRRVSTAILLAFPV